MARVEKVVVVLRLLEGIVLGGVWAVGFLWFEHSLMIKNVGFYALYGLLSGILVTLIFFR